MASTGPLRAVLRARLLHNMIQQVRGDANRWVVLVVDRPALRILAAVIPVDSLVDHGVTVIEMLDMRREPLPRLPAIYFITPSAESLHHFLQESPSQYRSFHLFLTTSLSDYQLNLIRKNGALLRKLKSLVELHIQFLPLESRLFTLDRRAASLPQLYSPQKPDEARLELSDTSCRLAEACYLLAPHLEWTVRTDASSSNCKTVASLVKEQLEAFQIRDRHAKKSPLDHHTTAIRKDASAATLIVLDRVSDLLTPLVHEFSYQAMAHDLLQLNYDKPGGAHVTLPSDDNPEETKVSLLDNEENDPIWTSIRLQFVQNALHEAQEQFKRFLSTDAAYKIRGKEAKDLDIKDMGAAVRALPNSKLRATQHAMHIKVLKKCLEVMREQNLEQLALAEQDLLIGRHPDGSRMRSDNMVADLVQVLCNEEISLEHRVRLLLMTQIICERIEGLGGEQSAFVNSATFAPKFRRADVQSKMELRTFEESCVQGMRKLLEVAHQNSGTAVEEGDNKSMASMLRKKYAVRQAEKMSRKMNAERHKRQGLDPEDGMKFDVARYQPPLRSVLVDVIDEEIDEKLFPVVGTVSAESIIKAAIASPGSDDKDEAGNDSGGEEKEGKEKKRKGGSAWFGGRFGGGSKRSSDHTPEKKRSSDVSQSSSFNEEVRLADPSHLYMVFVVGGVCYSEVRAALEVAEKRNADIVIGGSQVLNPASFMKFVAGVADPFVRIQAMLPPLPIELAQSRAAAKARDAALKAEKLAKKAAERKKQRANADMIEKSDMSTLEEEELSSDDRNENGSSDGRGNNIDPNGDVDVVVVEYKKKRGLKLFGKRR